ncbi:hypothetical protein QBC37DRAFT_426618 [Rhypophila decipiens]|uniref:Uncharacterized protein n=1 Tax=Rhypophila decipiens TaxID=261697 RepID=A0AAN6Y3L3_9PEZI|nr:hypothetical protein QBC37DRAFT_426618 [Rhypophila decipiens]
MLCILVFLSAFWAVLALAVNAPVGLHAPIPGYEISEITWEVDVFNNGTLFNLTGTIEQVHADVSKMNPNSTFVSSAIHQGKPADAADDWTVHCGPGAFNWLPARPGRIDDGIYHLSKVSGQPRAGPGPGACARVSCSWESAIWWCNDNLYDFALPSFTTIGDCAQMLNRDCQYIENHWDWVRGQNFVSSLL